MKINFDRTQTIVQWWIEPLTGNYTPQDLILVLRYVTTTTVEIAEKGSTHLGSFKKKKNH